MLNVTFFVSIVYCMLIVTLLNYREKYFEIAIFLNIFYLIMRLGSMADRPGLLFGRVVPNTVKIFW